MAQFAYENPDKIFVGKKHGVSEIEAKWNINKLCYLVDGKEVEQLEFDAAFYQNLGYSWEEKKEPRIAKKWQGEYVAMKNGGVENGRAPQSDRPRDVKRYRVKWEAEEIL